jgi:hypothetical protein
VRFLFACFIIAVVRFILDDHFGTFIRKRVIVGAIVLAIPIITTVRVVWAQIKKRRRATALGAQVVPMVSGKWLGNLDVFIQLVNNFRYGYPGKKWPGPYYRFTAHNKPLGEDYWEWIEQLGTTFDPHIFWEDTILTFEPENIKVCLWSSCRASALECIFKRQFLQPIFQITSKVGYSITVPTHVLTG